MKYSELSGMHYRYIHILWRSPKIFAPRIINLIKNNPDVFNVHEHLFVTNLKEIAEYAKTTNTNVVYIQTSKQQPASLINYVADYCDRIFVHCMCKPNEFVRIKRKNLKKIVWRTWGGDTSFHYIEGNYIKNLVKRVLNRLCKHRYRQIGAVAISNVVDRINIQELYGINDVFVMNYDEKDVRSILDDVVSRVNPHEGVNICIGHSGYKDDDHFAILNKLKAYSKENMKIYIPVIYGDESYINDLKRYAYSILPNKIIFVEKRMPYDEYAEFLCNMDVCIINGTISYALGNIAINVYFKKTIVLNRQGIIKKGFEAEKIPFILSDVIGTIPFSSFTRKLDYTSMKNDATLLPNDCVNRKARWKELMNYLEAKE